MIGIVMFFVALFALLLGFPVAFTFGGIANPVAGIVTGMVLMGESFTAVQYSLMTGMIIMSLLPQLILAIRQSKTVKPVTQ